MSDTVNVEQYREIATGKRPGKYKNKKTTVDGEQFDSQKEARRWSELRKEEKAGRITDLRRQVPFAIVINRMHVCNYQADFVYQRDGREVVEDVKGFRNDVYLLKKKLVKAAYGITILET